MEKATKEEARKLPRRGSARKTHRIFFVPACGSPLFAKPEFSFAPLSVSTLTLTCGNWRRKPSECSETLAPAGLEIPKEFLGSLGQAFLSILRGFRRKLGWPDILLVGLLWRILESAPYISVYIARAARARDCPNSSYFN